MKQFVLLATIPGIALAGCATGSRLPVDYAGTIKTQTAPDRLASCIGQAAGVAPVSAASGLVVQAPTAQPPRTYTIQRTAVESVITIQGPYGSGPHTLDDAAVHCAMPAPPSANP